MTGLREAIRAILSQVRAPAWAAANLDALADVLRDLSWLPDGPVQVRFPEASGLSADDASRLMQVLVRAVEETADGPRPVRLSAGSAPQ